MANGVNDPVGGLSAALTPEQIAGLQASAALMQQRIQAASDPNRNAAFDKYVADQAAKGIEVASTYTGGGGPLGSGGVLGVTDFAPAFDPASPGGTTGQVVRFDPERMNAPVVFQPGQQYVLTDASGEKVIGRASSVEELQKLAAAKESMPYGFQLYRADEQGQYQPGTQLFGETDPRTKGLMGAFVNYGLPIAAGIATGGLSFLPAVAASAAASGAARLMTGYTPEDAAKAAAIAAATRGVLKGTGLEDSLADILGGGASGVSPGEAAAAKLGYAGGLLNKAGILTDVAGNVVATGVGTPAAVLAGNVAGGALQTVTGSLGSAIAPAVIGAGTSAILGSGTTGPLTTVTGTSPNAEIGGALPAVVGTTPVMGTGTAGQQVTVSGQTDKPAEIGGALPAVVGTTPVMGTGTVGQQVTVSGQTDKPAEIGGALPAVVGTTPVMGTGTAGQQVTVSGQTDKPAEIGGALPAVVGTTPVMGTGPVGQQVTVSGQTDKPADIGGALPAVVGTTPVLGTGTVGQQVTVSGETDKPGDIGGKPTDLLAPVIGEFVASDIVGGGESLEQEQAGDDGKKGPGTIATVTGGLAILDALSKLLEGGGGGTGGAGTGLESLAPTFRAQLPTPRGQFAPQTLTQRDRSDIDYARYGYGPARSFFNYVPETVAERAAFAAAAAPAPRVGVGAVLPQALPGTSVGAPTGATTSVLSSGLDKLRAAMPGASDAEIEAFLATPEGQQALVMIFESMGAQPRAKGGKMGGEGRGRESFAVNGEGTGRSDEIPALLSDGEYVIDAETVALLGDGSSKAGAKRLNDFRVNIRKHKGRNLAKGKFSVNARRPERYLSGGQV